MLKMARSYQRPENALKRANEFIDVDKPLRALEVLYEVIKRGKMRPNYTYSEKLLEPIMHKYLQLCVDLKKSHLAKEGLYQYRNIFQSVNVSSLETVVTFYLHLADERTESARKESHQAVVDIDDLDQLMAPEEMLLSAVSVEDAQDRSDRTILTPWVKFLWESYRQCLELLRTNSRVEKLYHQIAVHAFKFCEKYNRKTEFRKLCDNLRTHLMHIQKQQGSATAVNLSNPETQQLNLDTRLEQLNSAIKMELWQEAYKAIEDISDLMKKSKKMPKPYVMSSYYEKLALVFWKAGNHLFHAATLFKSFQLLENRKNITPEELAGRSSVVLVATLAIPLPSAHPEFDRFIETEKGALEKIERLANLLSLPKPPTRNSLIRDLVRLNVVNSVAPELQVIYQLMENEFDPLNICARMQTHLDWIRERPESTLPLYIPALQDMTITRLVKQVSQIYQTITFDRLLELSVFMDEYRMEKILVDLVRHNDLQIRIDHRKKCIHFGVDMSESQREDLAEGPMLQTLPSERIRCQLVEMSSALQKCLTIVAPANKKIAMKPLRAKSIQYYYATKDDDHVKLLARQNIIEERKEMLENQNYEREEQIRKAQEDQLKKQKTEERDRLIREANKREKERREEERKEMHTRQMKDKLLQISKTSYGQKMIEKYDSEELLKLDADQILQRQVDELEKERKELQKKLKSQEKNVDFFERARRILEIPKLKKMAEVEIEKRKEFWRTHEDERIGKLIEEHEMSLKHSKRLHRIVADKNEFMEKLRQARHSDIEKKLNDFNAIVEVERKKRLLERKEKRRQERMETYYKKKEEDEQQRRDEELKRQREEDERKELERSKMELEREEEERNRRAEMERNERNKENEINGETKKEPWRPKFKTTSQQKEEEKMDSYRSKDERREPDSDRFSDRDNRKDDYDRFNNRDNRREEDRFNNTDNSREEDRFGNRDNRREEDRFGNRDNRREEDRFSNRDNRGEDDRFGNRDNRRENSDRYGNRDNRREEDRFGSNRRDDMKRDFDRNDSDVPSRSDFGTRSRDDRYPPRDDRGPRRGYGGFRGEGPSRNREDCDDWGRKPREELSSWRNTPSDRSPPRGSDYGRGGPRRDNFGGRSGPQRSRDDRSDGSWLKNAPPQDDRDGGGYRKNDRDGGGYRKDDRDGSGYKGDDRDSKWSRGGSSNDHDKENWKNQGPKSDEHSQSSMKKPSGPSDEHPQSSMKKPSGPSDDKPRKYEPPGRRGDSNKTDAEGWTTVKSK